MMHTLIAQLLKPNELNIPQGNATDSDVTAVLNTVFAVFGAVAFLVIVIAGLRYVISQGNPQATAQAKNTIIYALVGLVLAISALGIVNFVVRGVL